jgi:hypothetical protein
VRIAGANYSSPQAATPDARGLQIYSTSSSNKLMDWDEYWEFTGVVHGPRAECVIDNDNYYYGSLICGRLTIDERNFFSVDSRVSPVAPVAPVVVVEPLLDDEELDSELLADDEPLEMDATLDLAPAPLLETVEGEKTEEADAPDTELTVDLEPSREPEEPAEPELPAEPDAAVEEAPEHGADPAEEPVIDEPVDEQPLDGPSAASLPDFTRVELDTFLPAPELAPTLIGLVLRNHNDVAVYYRPLRIEHLQGRTWQEIELPLPPGEEPTLPADPTEEPPLHVLNALDEVELDIIDAALLEPGDYRITVPLADSENEDAAEHELELELTVEAPPVEEELVEEPEELLDEDDVIDIEPVEEPVAADPVVEEPVAKEEPGAEEPVVEEPVAEEVPATRDEDESEEQR